MPNYDIPFVPSSDDSVTTMIKLAGIRPGEKAIDLGAGDGKLVIAMARKGARATGVEIDEGRWQLANSNIKNQGLDGLACVVHGSFWEQDLGKYDLIVLYGVPSIMERLEAKIMKEARSNCRVISNRFEFPHWNFARKKEHILRYDIAQIRESVAR